MGRRERPLSQTGGPLSAFAAGLRAVRVAAGSPPYQVLAGQTRFSVATLSRAAAGNVLPSREVTVAFVAACGGDVAYWAAERERVRRLLSRGGQEAADAAFVAQLPADIGDFSGREEQIAFLLRALTSGVDKRGRAAVAVVTGAAGMGKTSLVVTVAHQLADRFPDGQLFVDLHGLGTVPRDPADVLSMWLTDLGASVGTEHADTDTLAARFRSLLTGKRMLIVIDNAKDTSHLFPLLPATSDCAVLATSRNRLAELPGAIRLDLEPLSEFEALAMLEEIVGAERLRAEPPAAAQILRACAGLPLALRIAGARLRARPSWPIAALATRLADQNRRLDELRIGDLAARTSFEASFSALPSADAGATPSRLLTLLGLITGPSISTAAAAALADIEANQAQQALEILVDAHLIQTTTPGRYHLHDLVRNFAAELADRELTQQDRTAAITRYIQWFIHAAAAARHETPPWGTVPVFDHPDAAKHWFRIERHNLLAAVTLAESALEGPQAQILACEVAEYLAAEMLWSDQIAPFHLVDQRAERTGDATDHAQALSSLAFALGRLHLQDGALSGGKGEPSLVAEELHNLGLILQKHAGHAESDHHAAVDDVDGAFLQRLHANLDTCFSKAR